MTKTQRMRPPSSDIARQADEERRHNNNMTILTEIREELDRIAYNTHMNAVATMAAGLMPTKIPMRREDRIELAKRCLTEAWAALESYDLLPAVDETS